MAFTETTFSLLRESVKQSMQEDKQKGLPTGKLIELILDEKECLEKVNDLFRHVVYNSTDKTFASSMLYAKERIALHKVKVEGGNILLDVTLTDENGKTTTKKGTKLGKIIKWLVPNITDNTLKMYVSNTTSEIMPVYVLFTDREIHRHYRVLSVSQNLNSCMSKKPDFYGRLRPDTSDADPSWVRFIYPTEPYNNSPNLRLALISRSHPDSKEFNKEGQYPFIARAIILIKEDGTLSYSKTYGIESAYQIFDRAGIRKDSTEGGLLNIIRDDHGNIVAPYVDPNNRLSIEDDYLVIDYAGGYEIRYDQCILYNTYDDKCWCDHCEEYHEGEDEDDYIDVNGVGRVYGYCRGHYDEPYRRYSYYLTENLYFSEYHDRYLHPDDAVGYIESISGRFGVEVDYIHEDDVDDLCKLTVTYEYYDYAHEDICVITEDGDVFIGGYQDDLYFEFEDKLYTLSKAVWSKAMGQYIPNSLAYLYFGDYYTKEYIEENFTDPEEPEETEELNDAA